MGLIQIEGMEFYSFHGHFKEEQIVGNRFVVDLTIETNMEKPIESDNLKDALNYQRAYEIVKLQMEQKSHLLEHIAGRIIEALYAEMEGIRKATVKVSKMNPPIGGKIKSVSVVLSR
jgi:dihydroneopterin aldolase